MLRSMAHWESQDKVLLIFAELSFQLYIGQRINYQEKSLSKVRFFFFLKKKKKNGGFSNRLINTFFKTTFSLYIYIYIGEDNIVR